MKTRKHDTHWMVGVALMAAIVVLLANTPLGMIQLPIIKATTVHIPVILGAILFGPLAGSILGGVFGICSVVSNTVAPTLLSFAFSPFVAASTGGAVGAVKALWIVGFVGSMTNTAFVMGSIYFLLAAQYAQAKQVAITAVYGLVMGTVTGSGVMEAIAALVLVTAIGKALLQVASHTMKESAAGNK